MNDKNEGRGGSGMRLGTILLIAGLAGMAAMLSPLGNAIIDQFDYARLAAARLWRLIVLGAMIAGFVLALADWHSRGKY